MPERHYVQRSLFTETFGNWVCNPTNSASMQKSHAADLDVAGHIWNCFQKDVSSEKKGCHAYATCDC